jgi:hypothetical protein
MEVSVAHATCALYNSDKKLLAVTEELQITDMSSPPSFHTFNFPNPKPNVKKGKYYYGMVYGEADATQGANKTFLVCWRKNHFGMTYYKQADNYPNFPDPLVVLSSNEQSEIYCNYEPLSDITFVGEGKMTIVKSPNKNLMFDRCL